MLPIIRLKKLSGRNGRNWAGVALVDPDAPCRAAVAAQEGFEAMHKLHPRLIVLAASKLWRRFGRGRGRAIIAMEIIGHECEVQAASVIYGKDRHDYRVAEVDRMKRGYDGLFDGVTRAQLRAAMEAQSAVAARWVRRNIDKLERVK